MAQIGRISKKIKKGGFLAGVCRSAGDESKVTDVVDIYEASGILRQ